MSETTVTSAAAGEVAEKQKRVDDKRFMTEWEKAAKAGLGVEAVAKVLGLEKESVQARASKYRSEYGIALTPMKKGGGAKINREAAMALLAELRGVEIDVVKAEGKKLTEAKAKRAADKAAKASS